MRIVCEKCAAAYAIDDRLISARGVRAQCPRCRHLQLVTREIAAAAAAAQQNPAITPVHTPRVPPEALPGSTPSLAPPVPPAVPASARPSAATSTAPSTAPSASTPAGSSRPPNAPPAPVPASAPPRTQSRPDWDVLPPLPEAPSASSGQSASSAIDDLLDFGLPPAPDSPGSPEVDDSLLSGRGGSGVAAIAGCRDCGKPLTDPFDQALGMCDECRAKADAAPVEQQSAVEEVRTRASVRRPSPGRASSAPLGPTLSADKPKPPPPAPTVLTAARADAQPEGGGGKKVLIAALVILVLGGGAAAFFLRDSFSKKSKTTAAAQPLPPAVQEVLPSWKMANVELSGTASEHLTKGQQLLREDRLNSYEQAIEEFQKALILDPRSDAAIAGYVEALAWGRGTRVDQPTWDQAMALLSAADKRSHGAPEVLLARAFLLLTRPQDATHLTEARSLAEEVVNKEKNGRLLAQAHLVIGRSWQSSSSPLAVESFTHALELDPELRAALYQRALANEASGNFSAALEDLEARLKSDPQHWPSNAELARIYRDSGRMDLARKVYERILEKNPDLLRARLELAVFRYQAENRLQDALSELRAMSKELERYDDADQVDILTHLATAERLAGNENAAVDAAQRALKVSPKATAPQLQLFLIAASRGLSQEAEKSFEALRGNLDDAGLEKLLEGRLRMLQNQWPEAVAAFDASVAADARRIDAQLLAGIAAANQGDKQVAYAHLLAVAKEDPMLSPPPPASSRFYFQPLRFLRGTEGTLVKLADGPQEVLPKLYEAVLRYRLGQPAEAAKLTAQVTDLDTNNALAHAWHAFALVAQGNAKGAKQSGERAVASGRTVALAQYASGSALAALKKDEEARRALSEALRLDPSLLGAEQTLAEIDARHDDADSARKRLAHVISLNPAWQPAKQLLYSLEKETPLEGAGPR